MSRGKVLGMFADVVIRSADGVTHCSVNLAWGRENTRYTFAVLCDFEAAFSSYEIGTIDLEKMRADGVRCSTDAYKGAPTCMMCIVSSGNWKPIDVEDVFG